MSEGSERKSQGGANTPNSQISRTSGASHSSSEASDSESSDSGSEPEPELTSNAIATTLPEFERIIDTANKRSKHSQSESSTSTEVSEKLTPSPVATSVPEEEDESSEESSSGSLMSEGNDEKPKAATSVAEDESSSSSSESSVASDDPPVTGQSSPSSTVASSTDVSQGAAGEKKGKSILQIAKNAVRTRVVFGKAEGRGKVEVMMGPRFKTKAWKPSTVPAAKGQEFHLLGNLKVDAWGDASDDEDSPPEARRGQTPASNERAGIVQQVEKKERKRKRQMFVDRWDANLDLGKVSTCRTVVVVAAASSCDVVQEQLNSPCIFCNVVIETDKENEEQRGQRTSGRSGSEEECLSAYTSWCPKNEPRKGKRFRPKPKGRKAKGTKAKGQGQEVAMQILTIRVVIRKSLHNYPTSI
jgi:hypothetical protein